MTPWSESTYLEYDAKLDADTLDWILDTGFSRIPVRAPGESHDSVFAGVLITKSLIKLVPSDATPVSSVPLRPILHVSEATPVFELLDVFQTGKCHMAAVYSVDASQGCKGELPAPPRDVLPVGVITLEDVIEELIKEEITDETDPDAHTPFAKPHGSSLNLLRLLRAANSSRDTMQRRVLSGLSGYSVTSISKDSLIVSPMSATASQIAG